MRANRHAKFGRHEKDTQNLADSTKTTRIDLANIDSLCLQELLECNLLSVRLEGRTYPVVRVLAGGNTDSVWFEALANCSVSQSIIRSCGLFNEPRLDGLEVLDVFDGLLDIPNL